MNRILVKKPRTEPPLHNVPAEEGREGLLSPSFLGLLCTQFLGALNDNLFRWLVAWIGADRVMHDPFFHRLVVDYLHKPDSIASFKALAVPVGLALFVMPFILFAAPAGFFADRFSKRTVIVGCKVAELLLMILGVAVIYSGNVWAMFFILFLMGAHSSIFGPPKYGSIPEIVRSDRLSAANGLIGMTTIVGIVTGTVLAGLLYHLTQPPPFSTTPSGLYHSWLWASALLGVALLGVCTSLPIRRLKAANPSRPFCLNFAAESFRDIRQLALVRTLFLTAAFSATFWALGGLCQANIEGFGTTRLGLSPKEIGPLLGMLAIGVGTGCVLAGIVSRGKIQMWLVPLGAAGIALCHILLYFVPGYGAVAPGESLTPYSMHSFSYLMTAGCLFLLGLSGGMYDVPLQAYLQHNSPEKSRGSIFAATNLLSFTGTLLATGIFMLLGSVVGFPNRTIFLVLGLCLIPLVVVLVRFTAYDSAGAFLTFLIHLSYRFRHEGWENVPAGGALLAANHLSWADGVLVGMGSPRVPRMVVFADYFEQSWLAWFGRLARVIPIKPGKRSIVESIRTAREALQNGELVCIFPEGGLSRSGKIEQFQPGIMSILKGTDAPVIPVYVDGMWGSIFSFERGRFFWKIPKNFRRQVTIRFGKPIEHPKDLEEIRLAVIALGGGKEEYRLT